MQYVALDQPENIPALFVQAWNNRDPATLASLFDEDAEFVNVTGLWWHDRAAIEAAHAYGLQRIFSQSALRAERVTVKRLSDDIAVVHARLALTHQNPGAGMAAPGPRHTLMSFVVHRSTDGWRCASAHNTDIVQGAETHVADAQGRLKSASYRR